MERGVAMRVGLTRGDGPPLRPLVGGDPAQSATKSGLLGLIEEGLVEKHER